MQGTSSPRPNGLGQIDDIEIKFLEQSDNFYPTGLKQLTNPPLRLYYRGNIELANQLTNNIAIVGTRKASIYGKTATQMLVNALSNYEATIVSGMAYGIDAAAHEAALTVKLPTIAVLGVGLLDKDLLRNPLYHDILNNQGLLLSEYPPTHPAQKWTFIERNRIISALSFCTVVIEAPKGSGALITAERSAELKRPIHALSGEINKSNFQGNIDLINNQIATPIFSAKLWAESLDLNTRNTNINKSISNPILELISSEPISLDTLIQKSKIPQIELSVELSKLTAKGYIRKIFGQKYIRVELN